MEKSSSRARTLVFLFSGLLDTFFGSLLLLTWLKILLFDLTGLGVPHAWIGLLGALLVVSGVVVIVYQITKLKEPDE
jgi:hypothetical protein